MYLEDGLECDDHPWEVTALEFQHGGIANHHFAPGSLNSQPRNKQDISLFPLQLQEKYHTHNT
jgi:hypothetical protein